MLFNSLSFAIFLPIVFLLYWFVFSRSLRLQNFFILAASYLFYGWWDWRFLILIAFTTACSFASGLLIEKYRSKGSTARLISVLNILVNLFILGLFKYYDFFAASFADIFMDGRTDGLLLNLILPVGISFYTFQALSYSIDVYKGKIEATHDAVQFFAYVSFFPQLVAGPIERATNLLPQFSSPRIFSYADASDGLRQMLWGFFKKIVVADNCATYVNAVYGSFHDQSASTLLLGAILFSIQIYGDFSGYSDIAIGTARLFGIRLMQNFRFPYFSRDIAEFWRRWHISLTSWFRDYIYIPLGGSRVSRVKVVRNTFIVYLVSGFWHGANWTFVAWGLYHAVLFLPLILLGKNRKYTDSVAQGKLAPDYKEFCQMISTFFLAVIGWILFRAESISDALSYIKGMCSSSLCSIPSDMGMSKVTLMALLLSLPILLVMEWVNRDKQHGFQLSGNGLLRYGSVRWVIYYVLLAIIILFHAAGQSFIYFQF